MCSPRVYWLLFEVCSPEASRAISSYSKTWPFHVDDWFRYSEEGEEGSGFGLCPLIILYYHTGGIYHQTPKASVHGEHWNQSHRLHAIHLGPQKTAMLSATTFIFSVRGEGYSKEKARNLKKKKKPWRKVGLLRDFGILSFFKLFFKKPVWCCCHSRMCKHQPWPLGVLSRTTASTQIGFNVSGTSKMMK